MVCRVGDELPSGRLWVNGQILLNSGPSRRGWHRLGLVLQCPQKYAWNYLNPANPGSRITPPLARGILIHVALAHHYERIRFYQQGKDPLLVHHPREAVRLVAADSPQLLKHVDIAMNAYAAYAKHWQVEAEMQEMEILMVEDVLETDVRGHLFTGRLDLAYRDLAGRVWVTDHKCQPASSRVLTDKGVRTVGELLAQGTSWKCASYVNDTTCWAEAQAPVFSEVGPVFEVRLKDGTSERYGYRHPILTARGWVQAQHLTEQDQVAIAVPPTYPQASVPHDVLRVLGLAMSDGGRILSLSASYVITKRDPRERLFITDALDRLGDSWAPAMSKQEVSGVRLLKGGQARGWLRRLGLMLELSRNKLFPPQLLSLDLASAGVLLGALWEGDGAAYLGTPSATGRRPVRIVFSSRSHSMAQGVRNLLLQFGILSNITTSTVVKAPYFQTVVVGRESKLKFLRLAAEGAIQCPMSVAGGKRTRTGRVLESFATLEAVLRDTRDQGSGSLRNPVVRAGVRWVGVAAIDTCGEEPLYDIEVPGPANFLTADAVVTHNSTSRITKNHAVFYSLHGQLWAYLMLARRKYGSELAGMRVNLVQHTTHRFDRFDLPPSRIMEPTIEDVIVDAEALIARYADRPFDRWPRAQNELTCFHRYGVCDFAEQCLHGKGAQKYGGFIVDPDDWG